jgi:hypothetical protein
MEEIGSLESTKDQEEMVHPLEPKNKRKFPKFLLPLVVTLLIIGAGTLTGYFLAGRGGVGRLVSPTQLIPGTQMKGKEFGSADTSVFKDTAVGVLEKGGIDGEGTHKLIREGGESQTAYLTSSLIDLDQLVGKKVQVWGETFKGQKAGWLMDVGRAKILE